MNENPYKAPNRDTSKRGSHREIAIGAIGGPVLGLVTGGIIGAFIGWCLGDLGGRWDPENVGFVSSVIGAAAGLAIALAMILRRASRLGWAFAMFLGAGIGAAVAFVFILLVSWIRRP